MPTRDQLFYLWESDFELFGPYSPNLEHGPRAPSRETSSPLRNSGMLVGYVKYDPESKILKFSPLKKEEVEDKPND